MTESTHERPLVGNVLLALAFVALVAVGVWTVIVPELQEDPEAASSQREVEGAASPPSSGASSDQPTPPANAARAPAP